MGNNNIIGAVWNEEGNIKLNGGTSIYSDGYAVYNENGSVSIEDEGYSKKIQGDIFSTKAGAVTDILLDTDDSYLEGASFKNNGGIFNFGLKNNAVWYVPQNSAVTNFEDVYKRQFQQFTKDTGIKVDFIDMSSGEVLSKLQAEKGKPSADVWFGGGLDSFITAKNKGLLEQYISPERCV